MPKSESREGFALAVTIFALVLLGALTTSGFYLARQTTRIGVASERATAAFYLAERGAMTALTEWQGTRFARLPQWSSATMADNTSCAPKLRTMDFLFSSCRNRIRFALAIPIEPTCTQPPRL